MLNNNLMMFKLAEANVQFVFSSPNKISLHCYYFDKTNISRLYYAQLL